MHVHTHISTYAIGLKEVMAQRSGGGASSQANVCCGRLPLYEDYKLLTGAAAHRGASWVPVYVHNDTYLLIHTS